MNWREYSLCTGMAQPRDKESGKVIDYFFDTYESDSATRTQINNLCSVCPVRKACLFEGMDLKADGVWGGEWLENGEPVKGKFE